MSQIPDDFCEIDPSDYPLGDDPIGEDSESLCSGIGVSQVQWRITNHSLPKHRPSIDYDPVLYHCENFEIDSIIGDLSFDDGIRELPERNGNESSISGDDISGMRDEEDNYIDIDDTVLEEESTVYTKPYIKLRVDWMS